MQYQFDGERERRAEFAMPKRTKQMGGIEQRLRIFVEDYVYTYLYQYGRSGGGAEKLAARLKLANRSRFRHKVQAGTGREG